MEEDNKYTLNDLITTGAEQKPLEFNQAFDQLMVDRLQSAIENKKIELAQSMFRTAEEE